ncbi:hypothetical protein ABL78_2865 [Leptomonas seymouri]|uniref:Uncharacterized protein n=1 Tax=Leptomonas seymouri TaxID=5684 RepID=A0A0N0P6U9_LEPSE|nr:hypothetical protein ABL78_2865 [Leptomonas seymouri]|eukprot:KPI88039.1 hypothetical protein ABL78_2865 [Leptomonas seymouri]
MSAAASVGGGPPSPAHPNGGIPRNGSGPAVLPPGAGGMMPRRGGVHHAQTLPPDAHIMKGHPSFSPATATGIGDGAGRGAALSMGAGLPGGSVSSQSLIRGAAPATPMRGKMQPPPPPQQSPPPGTFLKMPPGQLGKKMVALPPGMSPAPGPGPQRTPSPGAAGGAPPPSLLSGAPSSRASVVAGPPPFAPHFVVLNGKKMLVPPGTKLPGPAPPGMHMSGKTVMMGGPLAPPPPSSSSSSQQQQQQQHRQSLPRASFVFPPPTAPQSAHQPPQHNKKSGVFGSLSGALSLLKIGSDSDDEEKERARRSAAQQQQQQQPSPSGPSPSPQRSGSVVSPGAKFPPGAKAPPPPPVKAPSGPLRSGPPPPGAVKMRVPVGAQQTPPLRSASISSNAAELLSSPPPTPPQAVSPAAQLPHKSYGKAPPGASIVKKTPVSPPAAGGATEQSYKGQRSPEQSSLAGQRSSCPGNVSIPPRSSSVDARGQPQHPSSLPPGAKLISSPSTSVTTPGASPQHLSPQPVAPPSSLPSTLAGVLRVPSSTMLKGGDLPEAGVRTPPHPRRRLGESSDDSDEESKHDSVYPAVNQVNGQADSNNGGTGHGDVQLQAVLVGSAEHGDDKQQQQQQQHPQGADEAHDQAVSETPRAATAVKGAAQHGGDAAHPPRPSPSPTRHPEPSSAVRSSQLSPATAQRKKPASLPAARPTARSAAAAVAAKSIEGGEAKKTLKGRERRTASAEAAQRRRPVTTVEAHRTPRAEAEPASPREDESTQKPTSVDRCSASVVSTPSQRPSSAASSSKSRVSERHRTSDLSKISEDESSSKKEKRSARSSRCRSPSPQSKLKAKDAKGRDRSAPRKRGARQWDGESKSDDSDAEQLTSRELYRLVNALRDDKRSEKGELKVSSRRRWGSSKRLHLDSANEAENGVSAGSSEEENDWGLRRNHSSSPSSDQRPHRRRSVASPTRQRQKGDVEEARRRRSTLPASTVGIPWRYTNTHRSCEPFATPPPVRRPLGFINMGGGRYTRVGSSSPYVIRHGSATRHGNDVSVRSIPLDTSNTVHAIGHSSNHTHPLSRSLPSKSLDPATSAASDARGNAVGDEVRTRSLGRRGSPMSGWRESSSAYCNPQEHRPRSLCHEALVNDSSSTVDSQHPYCVPVSATLPSMQALSPIRRTPSSAAQRQQHSSSRSHQPYGHRVASVTAAGKGPIVEPSPKNTAAGRPSKALKEQQAVESEAGNTQAGTAAAPSPASTTNAVTSPLAALRRSAFFEQLHNSSVSLDSSAGNVRPKSADAAAVPHCSGSAGSAGWECARLRHAAPAWSRMSTASDRSAPRASSPRRQTLVGTTGREAGGSAMPSLIPTASNCESPTTLNPKASADAPAVVERPRNTVASIRPRASTPGAGHAQQRLQSSRKARASSVGAAVSAAASGPRSSNDHFNSDPYRPPSRRKEPVRLTRATIARLSTPQQQRSGAMLSPIARRSAGGDACSSTAQTCSKWLDEILGSTTVTASGVWTGVKGQDAAAVSALPIVDLRTAFKPRVAAIEGSGVDGAGKRSTAAAFALQGTDAGDYTRDFTGSRPRPHIPTVSFKHMVGVRGQSPAARETTTTAASVAGPAASSAHSVVVVHSVHNIHDGLPFEKYSSIRLHDPNRKSPWALAPEREGLDVLPGKPALSRRRRIPASQSTDGGPQSGMDDGDRYLSGRGDDTSRSKPVSWADGQTVVEEVHLDEHRRPYVVVRPLPNAEAAEAQRLAVARLSRPKTIYQRAEEMR